jgi:hypothetical protein
MPMSHPQGPPCTPYVADDCTNRVRARGEDRWRFVLQRLLR